MTITYCQWPDHELSLFSFIIEVLPFFVILSSEDNEITAVYTAQDEKLSLCTRKC